MNVVFADAGYFIASLDDRDPLHGRARDVAAGLGLLRIITTQMVVTEVLNYVSRGGEHLRSLAVQMVRELEDNPTLKSSRRRTRNSGPPSSGTLLGVTRGGA